MDFELAHMCSTPKPVSRRLSLYTMTCISRFDFIESLFPKIKKAIEIPKFVENSIEFLRISAAHTGLFSFYSNCFLSVSLIFRSVAFETKHSSICCLACV